MKKTIFVAALLAVSAAVFAQTEADFAYELNAANDGVVIVGYKGTAVRVTIPATIEGFPVKEIGPYAFSPGKEEIELRNNLGSIHANTSTHATSLYSVTSTWTSPYLTAKLTYKLTSVVIPEGVTKIGSHAFAETGPAIRTGNIKPTVTHTLASVTIPGTVTEIGEYAFQSCEKLAALALPPSLTTLGKGSFGACKSLKTITVPEGVTVLPEGVFKNCSALSGVTLPQSLTTIERVAFADCTALAAITIPGGVTSIKGGINDSSFIRSGLTSVNWPAKIPIIPEWVFQGLNLKTMVIPEGVTDIGGYAFEDCKSLTGVTLPSTIRNIHYKAFSGCSALTAVTIPDPVASISFPAYGGRGDNIDAFKGCSKLGLATQAKIKQLGYTGTFQ
jgi:hypothetical protein